jgi:hypothetical protein
MDPELAKSFSREELISMGEAEPETPKPGPDTQEQVDTKPDSETEQVPEQEPKAETVGEQPKPDAEPEPKEGESVPYERFSKIYGKAKQTEREKEELKEKLDLFKRDVGEYYAKYPDEKPDDWQPPQAKEQVKAPAKVNTFREMLGARVNDKDQPDFHGKTLSELMEMGPVGIAAAQDYYTDYVNSVQDTVKQAKAKEEADLRQIREDDAKFMDARAKELFKKPMAEVDSEQSKKVEAVVNETLAWMKKNGRLGYKMEDAFKIMSYDKAISDAEARGAKSLVDRAISGTVKSVNAGPTIDKSTDPYGKYLSMKEDQLIDMISTMPDAKYSEFLEKASPAFRQKFPNLPYLN